MQDTLFTIIENKRIAKDVYKMLLRGDTSAVKNAGEFVNIQLDGFYLRRPISVCDVEGDVLTLIYKVVGGGTEAMSKKQSAKVNYTYGTSRYNNGEWTALMNVKEDDTAVIEIVHEMFDDNGDFFTDHWVITGKIDKDTGTLEYSGCENTALKYDRLGRHENKIYNNGTGIIRFSGNSFSWTDTFRNEAKNLKLTKRG